MIKRRVINRIECDTIIKKFNIKISGKYEINDLGKIDVQGDVDIKFKNLNRLPLKFGHIDGNFKCDGVNLQSLKGAPEYVRYNFSCNNNYLTSLEYSPNYVGGTLDCSNNKLSDLKYCSEIVGRDLVCKMNKLKSLNGMPREFWGRLNCSNNQLNDFSGVSERFRGEIYANSNFLKNIKGFKYFDGIIFIDPTASSINTGQERHKNMKIELRLVPKVGYAFMPKPILDNINHIELILKFQRYYDIWSDNGDDELHLDNFTGLIEDILDGLE
jgi:hypothetical protein